jgi:hypothetical protein
MPTSRFAFSHLYQKMSFVPSLIGCMLQIKMDVSYMAASWLMSYRVEQNPAVIYCG